jgi:hypothetical protein
MPHVPIEMDQNPDTEPRRSNRKTQKPERLTFTAMCHMVPIIMPSLCFAMFRIYQTFQMPTSNTMPIRKSFEPVQMYAKVQSYETLAYNCKIDSYNKHESIHQERDTGWDIRYIIKHRLLSKGEPQEAMKLKIQWNNGKETWEHVEVMKRHDMGKVLDYAAKKGLMESPGWEWIKCFVKADEKLQNMKSIYLASKKEAKFKFGVQVARTPKHALQLDDEEKNNLWAEAFRQSLTRSMNITHFESWEKMKRLQ